MLECVINISEGRDVATLAALTDAAGADLLDMHTDPHHHRSVLTVAGVEAPRRVATVAIDRIDLRTHVGVHPRLGAVDVVPFVALADCAPSEAIRARDEFASWLAATHGIPCFLYGTERSLPEVRRDAFEGLPPDLGPPDPHPTAGATAVGARGPLVAYNVWLGQDLAIARQVARSVRGPNLRALGLAVGNRVQVSMNLIQPDELGPAEAYDRVADMATAAGAAVDGAELVGLIPASVLALVPRERWATLDLAEDRTIEARLDARLS